PGRGTRTIVDRRARGRPTPCRGTSSSVGRRRPTRTGSPERDPEPALTSALGKSQGLDNGGGLQAERVAFHTSTQRYELHWARNRHPKGPLFAFSCVRGSRALLACLIVTGSFSFLTLLPNVAAWSNVE